MTRNHLIGGTDAATLIGLGRISPLMLYLRLRGEMPDDFEGNEATEAGLLFEDHVAVPMVGKRLGLDLRRPKGITLALDDEPRIGASFDFEIGGDLAMAEIKLTGSKAMWGNPGEKVPVHVGAQTQFQMAVARSRGRAVPCVHVIAMFVPGFTMEDFPVEEDQEAGGVLLDRAREMLRRVDEGNPPTPGDESDARALYLGKRGMTHVCSEFEVQLMKQLQQVKAAEKEVAAQKKTIRDALIPSIGDATEIVHPTTGEVLATYRPNRMFDESAFVADHPDIAAANASFDRGKAEKSGPLIKKLLGSYMREPRTAAESVRTLKLKGE